MSQYTNTSNKLIVRETPRINAIHTEYNHIQRFAEMQPTMFDDMLHRSFNSLQMYSNPIQELMGGKTSSRTLGAGSSDTIQWKQIIKAVPSYQVENLESTNTTPGIRKTPFKIKQSQDYFSPGEIISPDRVHLARVKQDDNSKYPESGGWVYVLEYLDAGNVNAFFPPDLLDAGIEWQSISNAYGEGSADAASVHMDGTLLLQDSLADMVRFKASTSGYVDDLGVINFMNFEVDPETGQETLVASTWMSKVEHKLFRALDDAMWKLMYYGVGDENLSGEKGKKVRVPFGFKYQLDNWSNKATYNTLTSTFIRDFIMDLFTGKIDQNMINVVFMGGLHFELALDEALKRDTANFLVTENTVLRGSDPMNLSYGYQIREYRLVGGGKIGFKRLTFPDINITNAMRDPSTGRPIESGNAYVFNLSGELKNNLQIVQRANSLKYGYTGGTGAPWAHGNTLSYFDDEHSIIMRDRKSPIIQDITNCAALLYRPL